MSRGGALTRSAILLMAGASAATHGQTMEPTAQADETQWQLEEILVTARKVEENLQKTPVSVSVIDGAKLEQVGVRNVFDVSRLVPNVRMTSNGASEFTSSIRGIGTSEPLMTIDPPNGLYIDGVYIARQVGVISELLDLEKVQVLRGPQGTLVRPQHDRRRHDLHDGRSGG
jgi:Outer membrane receptor for ferrienterochelin and colicins